MTHKMRKLVVAGLLVKGDRILLTQRTKDQSMPLKWEFPGGKIEQGESPEQALVRELGEELGVQVLVGRIFEVVSHAYPEFDLLMLVYPCRLVGNAQPTCREVADLVWLEPAELGRYDILAADAPLVDRLRAEGTKGLFPAV